MEEDDETGWKHLHGDVFRFPPNASLFASFVGAGTQMLLVAACLFALSLLGTFYPHNRGAMRTAGIVLYALTAGVAGYVSACWYRMLGGKRWAGNVILTAALFCGPLFLVFSFANSVAWASGSTQALPFGTIVAILAVWALVTLPLTVLGGAAGKNAKSEYDAPCRTAKFPREIPPAPWYRTLPAQMIMAGFLPFSAIYIGELGLLRSIPFFRAACRQLREAKITTRPLSHPPPSSPQKQQPQNNNRAPLRLRLRLWAQALRRLPDPRHRLLPGRHRHSGRWHLAHLFPARL